MQAEAIAPPPFQDAYFTGVVARCVTECARYYGDRLVSAYVWGSVHRHEAARGASDLDLFVFVDRPDPRDRTWRNDEVNDRLEREYPDLAWGLIPHAIAAADAPRDDVPSANDHDGLARVRNREWALTLQRDATRVFGRDLTRGLTMPSPDAAVGQFAFEQARLLARHAAGLEPANRTDFMLPTDPARRLRKLARLAVLGGACLLMAERRFRSFRGRDVLPALAASHDGWAGFLDRTQGLYVHLAADASPGRTDAYLAELVEWLAYVQHGLDSAAAAAEAGGGVPDRSG